MLKFSQPRRSKFFFRTPLAVSFSRYAHLKKKTKPNPGAVTRHDQSNQGKKYYSLNSPQVKRK